MSASAEALRPNGSNFLCHLDRVHLMRGQSGLQEPVRHITPDRSATCDTPNDHCCGDWPVVFAPHGVQLWMSTQF